MGGKSKFHLFLILMFFLHWYALTRAKNFQREKHGMSFAKFVKDSSVKLNALKLASLAVSKLGECTFECINNQECYSVNFGRDSSGGKYSCELLEEDKFRQPSDLVVSNDFDYYYIKTPCMSYPCTNGATCMALYSKDDYYCKCLEGFTGKHCEKVNWILMTPSSVCFGAKDNSPGIFTTPSSGEIITFKLIHLNGLVSCALLGGVYSNWGCTAAGQPANAQMGTHITDSQKNRLLPKYEHMSGGGDCLSHYYSLPGRTPNSPELLFDNFTTPLHVKVGQEFQIWFAEDLNSCDMIDNGGQTCVKVLGLFV